MHPISKHIRIMTKDFKISIDVYLGIIRVEPRNTKYCEYCSESYNESDVLECDLLSMSLPDQISKIMQVLGKHIERQQDFLESVLALMRNLDKRGLYNMARKP